MWGKDVGLETGPLVSISERACNRRGLKEKLKDRIPNGGSLMEAEVICSRRRSQKRGKGTWKRRIGREAEKFLQSGLRLVSAMWHFGRCRGTLISPRTSGKGEKKSDFEVNRKAWCAERRDEN